VRGISIVAVLLAVLSTARAQPAPPVPKAPTQALPRAEDKAEADRLFEEGRTLLADGKRAEACERFDLSIRKDPRAVGTMLNLGLCREEVGQIATAVRYYSEARDRAHDQNLAEHEEAAKRKIALLSPRVPRLVITLPADLRGDVRVLVDEIVIARDALGSVEVDPGPHTIVVTAPGKLPYETNVEAAESEHKAIAIPALAGATTVLVREQQSRRALLGKILVVGGVALVGGGIGLGLLGQSNYWDEFPAASRDGMAAMDATHNCWTVIADGAVTRECNTIGRDATQSASRLANVGVATAVTGGLVALAGAVLWITAPNAKTVPTVSFTASPDGGSFAFTRTF
jgi:hypothetical protein